MDKKVRSTCEVTCLSHLALTQDRAVASPFMQFAFAASEQALEDAMWKPQTQEEAERTVSFLLLLLLPNESVTNHSKRVYILGLASEALKIL